MKKPRLVTGARAQKASAVVDSNWKKLSAGLASEKRRDKNKTVVSVSKESDVVVHDDNVPIVALDCEMVGDADGHSMLARVCVIDSTSTIIYDQFCLPTKPVGDYRTKYSGIKPCHLKPSIAREFGVVQEQVAQVIKGKLLVGHGLHNDLRSLKLNHPAHLIRDTARYPPFQINRRPRKLKVLALERLKYTIQEGRKGHDPSIDAKAALDLYLLHRDEWERLVRKASQ